MSGYNGQVLNDRRTSVGGIMNNLAMQRLNAIYPDSYTLIPKILWAFVGFLLVVFLVLPESPWVYALRDDQEACLKSLKRLYNGVPGSNPEEEYGVILRTLKHEKMLQEASNSASWQDFLEGTNRVSIPVLVGDMNTLLINRSDSSPCFCCVAVGNLAALP